MIKAGKVVQLAYSLKNDDGELLDRADTNEPFSYLHGAQQIVPGLESALDGLKAGDKKVVKVSPDQGYGEIDPSLKVVAKRSQFPEGADIKVGMQFEARSPGGHPIPFMIESISGDQVTLDGNHPLAGKTLHFDVEVLEIRDATEEEKSHGHAHGPGDHDH